MSLISVVVGMVMFSIIAGSALQFSVSVTSRAAQVAGRTAAVNAARHHALPAAAVNCSLNADLDLCSKPKPSSASPPDEQDDLLADIEKRPDDGSGRFDVWFTEIVPRRAVLSVGLDDRWNLPDDDRLPVCGLDDSPPQALREVTVRWHPGGEPDVTRAVPANGELEHTTRQRGPGLPSGAAWIAWPNTPGGTPPEFDFRPPMSEVSRSDEGACGLIVVGPPDGSLPEALRRCSLPLPDSAWTQLQPGYNPENGFPECVV